MAQSRLGRAQGSGESSRSQDKEETECPKTFKWKDDWCVNPKAKITQCDNLVAAINKSQKGLREASGAHPAALRKLARLLAKAADKVDAVKLSDGKLT